MVRFFRVGIVVSLHGLKGEVKISPTGQAPERFALYGTVLLGNAEAPEDSYTPYEIEDIKQAKNRLILKFKGVDTPEEARLLLKKEIFIPREKGVPLEEGEHYVADLLGLKILEGEEELGELVQVMETGANDVYVCRTKEGKELLIPVIPECILEASPEEGFIRVALLPGLKELYL